MHTITHKPAGSMRVPRSSTAAGAGSVVLLLVALLTYTYGARESDPASASGPQADAIASASEITSASTAVDVGAPHTVTVASTAVHAPCQCTFLPLCAAVRVCGVGAPCPDSMAVLRCARYQQLCAAVRAQA